MKPQLVQLICFIVFALLIISAILHFGAVYIHWRRYCKINGKTPYLKYWREKWLSTF